MSGVAGASEAPSPDSADALLDAAFLDLVVADVAVEEVSTFFAVLLFDVALARFVSEELDLVVVAFRASPVSVVFFDTRVDFLAGAGFGSCDEAVLLAVALAAVVALRTVFLGSGASPSTGSSAMTFFGRPGRFLMVSAIVVYSTRICATVVMVKIQASRIILNAFRRVSRCDQ